MANATTVEPIVPIGSETRNGHFITPTQCTSQCSTCALLRRHVELRSPAKLGSTPETPREANGPSTPTRRRDPIPNPYITPPRQFVRLMLQRKRKDLDTFEGRASTRTTESPSPTPAPTRDKRHERVKKRHDQRQSREVQTPINSRLLYQRSTVFQRRVRHQVKLTIGHSTLSELWTWTRTMTIVAC